MDITIPFSRYIPTNTLMYREGISNTDISMWFEILKQTKSIKLNSMSLKEGREYSSAPLGTANVFGRLLFIFHSEKDRRAPGGCHFMVTCPPTFPVL